MKTKAIKWTVADGREVVVTVALRGKLDSQGRERAGTYEAVITTATLAGKRVDNDYLGLWPVQSPAGDLNYKIGNIGVRDNNVARINTAMAELEQEPEVVEYKQRLVRVEAVNAEYVAHTRRVDNMMTCNGHSF